MYRVVYRVVYRVYGAPTRRRFNFLRYSLVKYLYKKAKATTYTLTLHPVGGSVVCICKACNLCKEV